MTDDRPKPMIEIGGAPVLAHNLELLARAGVREAVVNLHHQPDVIRDFLGDGSAFGMMLEYAYEPTLLGTAGALRNAEAFLRDDDFFVVYGDNLSTIDLRRLAALHRERKAALTLALYHREDPRASGIVALDESDRVTRFLEKPREEEIFSHWVNAGYLAASPAILDLIPRQTEFDIGRDLLPRLLASGASVYGYRMNEHLWWIDSLDDYARTQAAFEARKR